MLLALLLAIIPSTNQELCFSFIPVFASKDCERGDVLIEAPLRSTTRPEGRNGFCAVPVDSVARESVDLVEVNSFYDDQARLVFDQLLFLDWSHDAGRYQLRAWRMVKHQNQLPVYSESRGCFECRWLDGDLERVISAKSVRRTNTQYDPELTAREFLDKADRRELLRKPR